MNPRLPKEGSLDGVLNVKPDPPTMNAGMPRGISLDAIKTMNARKRLMDMGSSEVMRLLGDTHGGDYRHLFDAEKPHAFRHGIQDAGADEIMQLLQELDLNKSFDTAWTLMKEDTWRYLMKNSGKLTPIYDFLTGMGMQTDELKRLTLGQVERLLNDSDTYSFENDNIRLMPIYHLLMYNGMSGDEIENLTLEEAAVKLNEAE